MIWQVILAVSPIVAFLSCVGIVVVSGLSIDEKFKAKHKVAMSITTGIFVILIGFSVIGFIASGFSSLLALRGY